MDVYSHRVFIESQRSKADRQVANSLLRCWKTIGLPDYMQLDNQLNFRGSNRYPRSMGLVIRLCLHFEVTPVFIPIAEPWRNAYIEKFNDTLIIRSTNLTTLNGLENNTFIGLFCFKKFQNRLISLMFMYHIVTLIYDIIGCFFISYHRNIFWLIENVTCQLFDRLRHRCREE